MKTYQRISAELYWNGVKSDIAEFVRQCAICQQNKIMEMSPARLLQPLLIPEDVWDIVSMDFIECLPKSTGFDSFLVVVDRLSKYAHFIGLKHPFSATTVVAIFVRHVICLHSLPREIVSDQECIFISHF